MSGVNRRMKTLSRGTVSSPALASWAVTRVASTRPESAHFTPVVEPRRLAFHRQDMGQRPCCP